MPSALIIPDDFGSGGKGLSPSGSHGTPSLRDSLRASLVNGPTSRVQSGRGTLVAGTLTIDAGVAISDDSRITATLAGALSGTTNFAGLSISARTSGEEGTAEFTIQAITAAGALDADAAAAVDFTIVD